jgi:hypothetical protein
LHLLSLELRRSHEIFQTQTLRSKFLPSATVASDTTDSRYYQHESSSEDYLALSQPLMDLKFEQKIHFYYLSHWEFAVFLLDYLAADISHRVSN